MVSITLAVPIELKDDMDTFPEMNWSAVAREAIRQKILLLKKFRDFSNESSISGEDALKLGKEVNKSLAKKYSEKKS